MCRSMFQTSAACLRLSRAVALAALCTLPQMPLLSGAQPLAGASRATGQLMVTLVVPPIFNVLEVTPVKDGYEYRVWTNVKSMVIRGREYRFGKIGETTLKVDGDVNDIDRQLDRDRNQGLAMRSAVGANLATGTGAGRVLSPPDNPGRDIHTVTVTY
jgi:hypothetical protein